MTSKTEELKPAIMYPIPMKEFLRIDSEAADLYESIVACAADVDIVFPALEDLSDDRADDERFEDILCGIVTDLNRLKRMRSKNRVRPSHITREMMEHFEAEKRKGGAS